MQQSNHTIFAFNATDQTQAAFNSMERNMKRTQKAGRDLNVNFRQMRGGIGQLGHQIQDVAVQLQAGQDGLLVLGQQGSQVASIFGPGGALLGAVLAISAAVASAFIPSLVKSTDAVKNLEKASDALTIKFEDLSAREIGAKMKEYALAADLAKEESKKLSEEIDLVNRRLAAVDSPGRGALSLMSSIQKGQGDFSLSSKELADELENLQLKLSQSEREAQIYEDAIARLRGENIKAEASAQKLIKSLEIEAATLGMTETATLLYKQALEGVPPELLREIELLREKIDLHKKEQEATEASDRQLQSYIKSLQSKIDTLDPVNASLRKYEEAVVIATDAEREQIDTLRTKLELLEAQKQKLKDQRELERELAERERGVARIEALERSLMSEEERIADSYLRRQEMVDKALEDKLISEQRHAELSADIDRRYDEESLKSYVAGVQAKMSAASQLAGAIAGFADEGSKAAKAAALVQKGVALAEATINMHKAIGQANALPFPLNLVEIARAGAVGLSAVSGIKAASFEGGGITFNGVRSGGVDGKGGRMAVVHPNEKIDDMEKGGQSMGGDNYHVTIHALDSKSINEMLAERPDIIRGLINKERRDEGKEAI